jgi:2-methylfumaryl-CoA isomerase
MALAGGILAGLRVVELSAFVAAPLGGATLAGMGADVIRIDPIGGSIDINRWPLHKGRSLYWDGLNQGKRSVALDLRSAAGQQVATRLITGRSTDADSGIVLTNLGVAGWMAYERLRELRPDLIMLVISGNPDGSTAVDYTVNAAIGFPFVTGPEGYDGPVNHVMPAWDALTGYLAATAILAAERHRRRTGEGQLVEISLADVALAVTAHLGIIAEAALEPEPRGRFGNDVYGTFAHDFATRDGRRVIAVALTPRQWRSLGEATGLTEEFTRLEMRLGLDLTRETNRFAARREITAVLTPWVAEHDFEEVKDAFERYAVLWGPYQTFKELVAADPRCSPANPLFAEVDYPGIGRYLAAGSAVRFGAIASPPPRAASRQGEDTESVLREVAGLSDAELAELRNAKVIK